MLRLQGCTTGFNDSPLFNKLSLEVAAGELLVVVGRSGCGKTTLLHTAAGIHTLWEGSLLLDGSNLRPGDRRIGFVQQHYGLFPWFTVEKNVALGLRLRGVPRKERRRQARRALIELGLSHRSGAYPGRLSGGEQQRVALAAARTHNPKLLLLDEPFSSLDAFSREELQEALLNLQKNRSPATLMVTHSLEEAIFLADRIAVMYGTPSRLESLSNPWTTPRAARRHGDRARQPFVSAVATLRRRFEELTGG